jgi:hypothetical protein
MPDQDQQKRWSVKGTVPQDFWLQVFFMNQSPPNLPPVSLTPVANLSPVSTTLVKLVAKFAAGVVDTGGKFATGVLIHEKNQKQQMSCHCAF